MTEQSAAAQEAAEAAFRRALADGTIAASTFTTELFCRCRDAVIGTRTGSATALDVAVLIRQVLRRGSERDGAKLRMLIGAEKGVPTDPGIWRRVGVTAVPGADGRLLLAAEPYQPAWLAAGTAVDQAAAAGTPAGQRAVAGEALTADPFFAEVTGYATYKTPGQRAAVRAAAAMPGGGTLIAELPTGSGKTEIAVSLTELSAGRTVIIVVPTVALAYDFERRFRDLYQRRLGPQALDLPFAWTERPTTRSAKWSKET